MCGRYSDSRIPKHLREKYPSCDPVNSPPRYNIAPTQLARIFRLEAGDAVLHNAKWGLETNFGKLLINAKSETVMEKRSFKDAFVSRRCLVVADGFYEWKTIGTKKQPHRITQPDGEPFCFAGIWEDAPDVERFCILTTAADEQMKPLHDRMPLIVPPEFTDQWLSGNAKDAEPLLTHPPQLPLKIFPVNPIVNNAKNETPECIEPFEAEKELF
jgi:putative SOS response-associated peptidase YedK